MNTLIVYRSLLGTTKRYAQWLGKELSADIIDFGVADNKKLDGYDTIIISSGTYAGKMPLVSFLEKHWDILKHKKVIVMAVGIAPAEDAASIKSYELIPAEIRMKIRYFKVPGKMFGLKPAGEPSPEQLKPVISYIHGMR